MNERKEYPLASESLETVGVWDPLVRVCHWSLVGTFFLAYFTEDELLTVHVWAGYAVGCIVILRVLWGFIGPKYARFSDFVFGPQKVWSYLADLVSFRAKRYLGHSPAGGTMAVALLIGLTATVWSGLETYAIEENAGPFAGSTAVTSEKAEASPSARVHLASEEGERKGLEESERESKAGEEGEFWEEAHEFLADLMLALVIIHLLGVGFTSVIHRENLVRAMITGNKRVQ